MSDARKFAENRAASIRRKLWGLPDLRKNHACDHSCWCPPTKYLFGLVEKWPDGGWSFWCPKWAQPLVFWVLRRLD